MDDDVHSPEEKASEEMSNTTEKRKPGRPKSAGRVVYVRASDEDHQWWIDELSKGYTSPALFRWMREAYQEKKAAGER